MPKTTKAVKKPATKVTAKTAKPSGKGNVILVIETIILAIVMLVFGMATIIYTKDANKDKKSVQIEYNMAGDTNWFCRNASDEVTTASTLFTKEGDKGLYTITFTAQSEGESAYVCYEINDIENTVVDQKAFDIKVDNQGKIDVKEY